jgi:hypothetical protein
MILMAGFFVLLSSCDSATSKIKNDNPEKVQAVKAEEMEAMPSMSQEEAPAQSTGLSLDDVDGDKLPEFSFDKESHDFGRVDQGDQPATSFKFTNTGNAPLIITSAKGSCGCTVPKWPTEPVAPGEQGVIDVTFDSKGRTGKQMKTVTLTANTVPNTKVLTITSEVIAP